MSFHVKHSVGSTVQCESEKLRAGLLSFHVKQPVWRAVRDPSQHSDQLLRSFHVEHARALQPHRRDDAFENNGSPLDRLLLALSTPKRATENNRSHSMQRANENSRRVTLSSRMSAVFDPRGSRARQTPRSGQAEILGCQPLAAGSPGRALQVSVSATPSAGLNGVGGVRRFGT